MVYYKMNYKWKNIVGIILFHIYTVYVIPDVFINAKVLTLIWMVLMALFGGFGVTAGVHRYWSHRSYDATDGFKMLLAAAFSVAGQNTIFDWVRDHRVHHRYSDTNSDPHNINRGFWFSHVGWLMIKKHPDVIKNGRKISMEDILQDPIVKFHTKYFIPLKILLCFLIPMSLPVIMWNEMTSVSINSQLIRYALGLNFTWSVNSAAHMWGTKPYNKNIKPCDNKLVSVLAIGEGWHNYHHVFPYDYKTSEIGCVNFTTFFLNIAKKYGYIYNTKEREKTE
nr:MAG: acyl-CoA delta(11) desaturase-like protein [Diabrotica toursvirus 3a]